MKKTTIPDVPLLLKCKVVRLNPKDRLPFTGFVLAEEKSVHGEDLYKVIVYGYSARPEYWLKKDCEEIKLQFTPEDLKAWVYLMHQNNK